MPHTIFIDRGDHWEVIADYSGSSRHTALSEPQWQDEYSTGIAYQSMRDSQPGSVAGITPKGCGKWLKDWSSPFTG